MTNYTQWKSLVDLHEYSAIPDSAVTHIDLQQEDLNDQDNISTLTDFSGNGNDFAGGSPTFVESGLNDLPSADFDGEDDQLTNDFGGLSRPFTIFSVSVLDVTGLKNLYSHDGSENLNYRYEDRTDPDVWRLGTGTDNTEISTDDVGRADGRLGIVRAGDSDTRIELNGFTDTSTESISALGEVYLGSRFDDSRYWDGYVNELLILNEFASDSLVDEQKQRMIDRWNLDTTEWA